MHQNVFRKKVFTKILLLKSYALKYSPGFYRFMAWHNRFKKHKVFKKDLSK